MMPVLFGGYELDEAIRSLRTNGSGPLEAISATIAEELNGPYTAEVVVPAEGRGATIRVGDFVKLKVPIFTGDFSVDLFKITKIKKTMNKTLTLYANHISYALNNTNVKDFELVHGLQQIINKINENKLTATPFIISGFESAGIGFELTQPASIREIIGGLDNNLIELFKCDVRWRGQYVELETRGSDKGYSIEYGKNLVDFNQEENIEKMVDGVTGYAKDREGNLFYISEYITQEPPQYPKMQLVNFQDKINYDLIKPIDTQLREAINEYITFYAITEPVVNIALDFVHLPHTDQYKQFTMEGIELGDTITVQFPALKIYNVKSRIISYTWDSIEERYTGIQIGTPKQTIEQSIANYIKK